MPSPAAKDSPAEVASNRSGFPDTVSRTELPTARLSSLTARELWRPSTPERLRNSWKKSPETDGWKALQKALRSIEISPLPNEEAFGDPLQWGVGEVLREFAQWRADTLKLIDSNASAAAANGKGGANGKRSGKKRPPMGLAGSIEAWCDAAPEATPEVRFALESLTWAYALPAISAQVDSHIWWRLAEQLDATAVAANVHKPGKGVCCNEMLIDQLLAGELALVLSTVLPHARPWRALGKQATDTLTEGVLAWTDGEGLPPGRALPCLGLIAACWTRCRRLSYQSGGKCWDASAQTQYEWLVRQLLRLADRDGVLPLNPPTLAKNAGMLRAALDCAGDDSDLAAARLRLGARVTEIPPSAAEAPDASVNSEWSGVSLLSAGWGRKDARLLVAYDQPACRLSLTNMGATLLGGEWATKIQVDGTPLEPRGGWEEQCWFTDDDCDFLNFSIKLKGGGSLERVVLLAKQDAAAMLLDIVHTGRQDASPIQVETRLPLAEDLRFDPSEETREGWLGDKKRQLAGVIPPALAEWRADPRGGELTQDDDALVLTHEAVGRAIACPVWFDLKPKRFAKQRTWRQLTVAESLAPVARDVAVGYRVQAGKDQWLLYRSLAKKANRTVLGQNYSSESFFGRFDPKTGLADEYFEVEA